MNWPLLQNSLLVSALATLFSVLLGFISALWLAGLETRSRKFISLLAILALALPPFLVTNCWLQFLGHTGVWRSWLPLNIFSLGGTIWILTLMTWPITLFFTLVSWRRLEQSQLEVDPMLTDGSLLKWLLIPIAKTSLTQAAVLTFILALNNFAVPAILQVKVFPAELWVSFNTTFDYRAALQIGWPMIVAPLLLLFVFRGQTIPSFEKKREISAAHFKRQLGKRWFVFGGVVCVAAIFFSAVLPLSQLLFASETWGDFVPALSAGKSAVFQSALLAALAATVIVAMAVTTSRWQLRSISWISFLIPGVILGIFLIWVFNRPPMIAFYQSIGIVVLAFAVRYFAPGWNIVAHALRTTDRNVNDAARLEGANRWQIFFHVQLPQIFSPLGVAWYVSYLFCLWDVETLVLIVPPGSETVSLRIFNLLHYGHNSQVNALCVLLLGLAILPLAIWFVGGDVRRLILNGEIRTSSRRLLQVGLLATLLMLLGCSVSETGERINSVQSKIFSHVEIIGSRGTGAGQFNKPRSLALDRDDNLFVADMTGRIQKFSSNGMFLAVWQMEQTDLGKPKGMCRDQDGNIVVIEPHYSRVNHFSPAAKLLLRWGDHGTNEGQLAFPRGVGVNSRGEMYVSEYGLTERVQRFSHNGEKFLNAFGRPGDGAGEFNRAEGLGIDSKDQVYVADSCNHRVQVFTSEGKVLRSYGKAGNGVGELSYPYDVRVDATGLQFVCEFGNSRIQIFDANDKTVEMLGEAGSAPGDFANPWSIDLDSQGNLYVADSSNHRVQKFVRVEQASRLLNSASRRILFDDSAIAKNLAHPTMFPDGEIISKDDLNNLVSKDARLRILAGRRNQQAGGLFHP